MSGGFCRRVGLNGLTYESGLLNFDWIIKGDSGFNWLKIWADSNQLINIWNPTWQEKEEKAEKLKPLHPRQSPNHPELAFNSPSAELADSSGTPTTPKESELVHPSISLQSSNTWLLRSWSWQETPPRTTRRPELSPDTFFWPSETTRNSTNCCTTLLLLREVCCPTSVVPFQVPSKAAESHPKPFDCMEFIMCIFFLIEQSY